MRSTSFGGLRDEHVAMLEFVDQREAFGEEMAGTGQRPGPARRMQFRHRLACSCRAGAAER